MACCVPLCPSVKKKTPNLLYHVFPEDDDLRLIWAKVISRREESGSLWMPTQRSLVCGKHFLDEDYDSSNVLLKTDVIPTVFPEYPAKVLKRAQKIIDNYKNSLSSSSNQPDVQIIDEIIRNPSSVDRGIQVNVLQRRSKAPLEEVASEGDNDVNDEKIAFLKKENELLLTELKKTKRKLDCKNYYTKIVKQLLTDSLNGNEKAAFLVDQMECYGRPRMNIFKPITMKKSLEVWLSTNANSYQAIKDLGFLTLPALTTLRRKASAQVETLCEELKVDEETDFQPALDDLEAEEGEEEYEVIAEGGENIEIDGESIVIYEEDDYPDVDAVSGQYSQ